MLAIDVIGIIFTILITGIRYPHYVILAVIIHHFAQLFTVFLLHGTLNGVIAAGAFNSVIVSELSHKYYKLIILFSGSITSYLVSTIIGGVEFEPTSLLICPWAKLRYPFAVINLRLAVISFLLVICSYLY